MASMIRAIDAYDGTIIYHSDNTHPGAKTRALITYVYSSFGTRFRYETNNAESYKSAYNKLAAFVDKHKLTAPAPAPGNNNGKDAL